MPGTLSKVARGTAQITREIVLKTTLAILVIIVGALFALAGLLNFLAHVVS